jgi:hypothetical protein
MADLLDSDDDFGRYPTAGPRRQALDDSDDYENTSQAPHDESSHAAASARAAARRKPAARAVVALDTDDDASQLSATPEQNSKDDLVYLDPRPESDAPEVAQKQSLVMTHGQSKFELSGRLHGMLYVHQVRVAHVHCIAAGVMQHL